MSRGQVALSWGILEKGDGGMIQLLYAGGPGEPLSVTGVVEGQRNLTEQRNPEQLQTVTTGWAIAAFSVVSLLLVIAGRLLPRLDERSADAVRRAVVTTDRYLRTPLGLLLLALTFYFLFGNRQQRPPFGF